MLIECFRWGAFMINYISAYKSQMIEAVAQRCSVKKVFVCNFIKKDTLAQVFSCEFCKISKNTLFTEHL